jgi:hypothetical protein
MIAEAAVREELGDLHASSYAAAKARFSTVAVGMS